MASPDRPLSPHLQIYRPQWTSVLSITHRATGVALALGALALAWGLLALAGDQQAWSRFTAAAGSVPGLVVGIAFLACLAYHFFNGIRHLVWDTGWGLDIPRAFWTGMAVIALSVLSLAVLVFVLLRGVA